MSDADKKLQARGGDMDVRVKPLVWKQAGGNIKEGEGFSAWPDLTHAPVTIYRKHDGWWLSSDCKTYPTLEAAKAAAQADYEARILAALEPAPDLMAELVDALRLLVGACNGEVEEVFGGEIGPSLRSARATLAKLAEGDDARLIVDCELAAKVLADTGTFETGQSILREAAARIAALTAHVAEAQAKVAAVTSDRAYIIGANAGWEAAVEHDEASPAAAAMLAQLEAAEAERDALRDRVEKDAKAHEKEIAVWAENYAALRAKGGDARAEAWAVFDPNWGEPVPLLTTIRETEADAIGAAITTQERGASIYSGYATHPVPQILGDWGRMQAHGYSVRRVALIPEAKP